MKFEIILDSPKTALVKATYLNKDFQYIFLDIFFSPLTPKATMASGKGEFTFSSPHLQPPLDATNPLRHKIIRSEFHRRTDVNTVVKASSLEDACTQFFTPFQDTFQIVWENKKATEKKTEKPAAKSTKRAK